MEEAKQQLEMMVDDRDVANIDLKMKEADYVMSMAMDLQRRINEVNPSCKIKFVTYREFVHRILSSGLHDFTIDFTKEYCNYIDRCANKIYTICEYYNKDIINFEKID